MGVVRVKDGVEFKVIAPGGFRILRAIDTVADKCSVDLTITSGTDGMHSGPDDPHHRGEAYDIRSQNLGPTTKETVLNALRSLLDATGRFYTFLEAEATSNEHFHAQVKRGTTFP